MARPSPAGVGGDHALGGPERQAHICCDLPQQKSAALTGCQAPEVGAPLAGWRYPPQQELLVTAGRIQQDPREVGARLCDPLSRSQLPSLATKAPEAGPHFVAANFMVYLYKQGYLNSLSSNIQTHCHYQGNVEGYPNSVVTLSTCSGLRGILQFENVSYGIEPLESAVEFQHLLYKLGKENNEFPSIDKYPMDYNIFISEKLESDVPDLFPLYLEMHVVVDNALYDYWGSDSMIVANKVIEILGLVNSMFTQFKVTVVLSSLELWSEKNKISTAGEADELLHRFLEWKQSYLTLRPHDIAHLFIYRDYPNHAGATFPGKMCVAHYSAGIALYSKEITLEAFSIIVTQMLARSFGISYDDPKECQCSETICVMNPYAMQSSGMKTFSTCSLNDFKHFVSNVGARCLQNKPQLQDGGGSVCGNGVVDGDEACDCGTPE
ncbi:disintegrin and metalloproteinase domain-containing protein 32-like, partial [Otolemur garnettii]|uniref:disintegrin and metalloproteinase domain-containing protein 32-like n=1 Tax=Otolemur garnettii TaxID=30611 RepID=UPI0006442691